MQSIPLFSVAQRSVKIRDIKAVLSHSKLINLKVPPPNLTKPAECVNSFSDRFSSTWSSITSFPRGREEPPMPWQRGNHNKRRSHQSSSRWWAQAKQFRWRSLCHSSSRAPSSCPQSWRSRCTLKPSTTRSWQRLLSCTKACRWGATQPSSARSRRPLPRWILTDRTRPSPGRGAYLTSEALEP